MMPANLSRIALCCLIAVLLALPSYGAGKPADKNKPAPSTVGKITGTVYDAGAGLATRTEGLVSGCLRTTFSFFNPCLDVVKTTAGIALIPIEKPMDYVDGLIARRSAEKQATALSHTKKRPAR